MRTLFLYCFAALFFGTAANARQITCSNNTARPAQYSSWTSAYNSCGNLTNDTIILYGSPVSYGTQTIKKKVSVFGEGWAIGGGYTHDAATFDYLGIDSATSSTNGNGCTVSGIKVNGYIEILNIRSVELDLVNCNYILYSGPYNLNTNFHLIRSCLAYVYSNNQQPCRWNIENSYFTGTCAVSLNDMYGSTINHCLIFGDCYRNLFARCDAVMVQNNIIISEDNLNDINHGTFKNNFNVKNGRNLSLAVNTGTNVCSGNIESGTLADFINYGGETTPDISHDYRLTASSRGKGAATDGTDIGPEGGAYPFYFQLGAYPSVPAVTNLTVTTPRVVSGGTLQFSVNAVSKNPR